MLPYRLAPRLTFLGGIERLHIAYSKCRLETADVARRLVVYVTGESIKLKYPRLRVSWEILDYDAPANIEVDFIGGGSGRYLIEGFSERQRQQIIDDWQFTAKLEPWPETLAPQPPKPKEET